MKRPFKPGLVGALLVIAGAAWLTGSGWALVVGGVVIFVAVAP